MLIKLGDIVPEKVARVFLKPEDHTFINHIFIYEGRRKIALRRLAIPPRRFESFFLIYRRRRRRRRTGKGEKKRRRSRERNGQVCEQKRKEEARKQEGVACLRAAGLMSLIMEKYIKRHPLYFLKGIPHLDFHPSAFVPLYSLFFIPKTRGYDVDACSNQWNRTS